MKKSEDEYLLRRINATELELKKQVATWFQMKEERDSALAREERLRGIIKDWLEHTGPESYMRVWNDAGVALDATAPADLSHESKCGFRFFRKELGKSGVESSCGRKKGHDGEHSWYHEEAPAEAREGKEKS